MGAKYKMQCKIESVYLIHFSLKKFFLKTNMHEVNLEVASVQ